ncbi:MAG: hypothetical protein QM692_07180 [Thermomicrobiales bacterium]
MSEGRLVAEPIRQPISRAQQHAPPSPPPPELRSDVLRARVAYRENTRSREAAIRQTESVEAGAVAPDEADTAGMAPYAPEPRLPEQAEAPPGVTGSPPPMLPAGGIRERADTAAPVQQLAGSDLSRWLGEFAADSARVADPAPEPEVDREQELDVDPVQEPVHPELELANLYEFASMPLPLWFRQDLPQVCRTCRDFRPAADGQRGWCANRWAFPERTLVGEDDPAPCATAIGSWWASVDDVWLVAADISDHGRPTPLMDRFFPPKIADKKRTPGAH